MQMIPGQQPNQISDFDLMTELSTCIKQSASLLTNAVMESANPQLRQLFQSAQQTAFQHHEQLSKLMIQKGYYKPLPSSPEMMKTLQDQIQTANAQVGGPLPPGVTQGVQPNLAAPATGVGPISPQTTPIPLI